MPPTLSRAAIRRLIEQAMRRGVPRADAEDLVQRAWERAASRFDPDRGTLEALLTRTVEREAVDWWRRNRAWSSTREKLANHRKVVPLHPDTEPARTRAAAHQQQLLDLLTEEERRVFAAWALQKHLPQGEFTAPRAAATLGMSVPEFNNAKRRLASRIQSVLDQLGITPRDLWSVADDEGPRRKRHA